MTSCSDMIIDDMERVVKRGADTAAPGPLPSHPPQCPRQCSLTARREAVLHGRAATGAPASLAPKGTSACAPSDSEDRSVKRPTARPGTAATTGSARLQEMAATSARARTTTPVRAANTGSATGESTKNVTFYK